MPEQKRLADIGRQRGDEGVSLERSKINNPQLIALADDGELLTRMINVDAFGLDQLVLAGAGLERGGDHVRDHAGGALNDERNMTIGRQHDGVAARAPAPAWSAPDWHQSIPAGLRNASPP